MSEGRASFTVAEIAQRNAVSRITVYRAIAAGKLKASRLGDGERRGLRITPAAEVEWIALSEWQPEMMGAAA